MNRPEVVFWQNMPSHTQSGALEYVAETWGAPVAGVWCEGVAPERKALGWASPEHVALKETTLPRTGFEREVDRLLDQHRHAIHVLSGIGPFEPITYAASRMRSWSDARIGIIVEGGEMWTWKKWPRIVRHYFRYLPYRSKIGAVLAMGSSGVKFYRSIGFTDSQIYPYCYQSLRSCAAQPLVDGAPVRIAYVGQYIHRKGVDLLVEALGRVKASAWTLDLYGSGPDEGALRAQAQRLGIADRVHFRGVIGSDDVARVLSSTSLVAVPSRFDGWGVVTNEALQCGVPAIVSDRAASHDLVVASSAGAVYPSTDVDALARLIEQRVSDRALLAAEHRRAAAYGACVLPPNVGRYLGAALEHAFLGIGSRPTPPWLQPVAR